MAELWDSLEGAPPHLEGSLHEAVAMKQGAQESGMPGMEQNCLRKTQHGVQVAELEGWAAKACWNPGDAVTNWRCPDTKSSRWVSFMVLLLLCMIFLCHVLVPPFWGGHIHHCIVEACNLFLIL